MFIFSSGRYSDFAQLVAWIFAQAVSVFCFFFGNLPPTLSWSRVLPDSFLFSDITFSFCLFFTLGHLVTLTYDSLFLSSDFITTSVNLSILSKKFQTSLIRFRRVI